MMSEPTRILVEFHRQAERVTRLRPVLIGAALVFMGLPFSLPLLTWLFPQFKAAKVIVPASGLAFIVLLVTLLLSRRLRCPACRQWLVDRFGPFCPECGSRSLQPPDPCDIRYAHPCTACGREFRPARRAGYIRLQFCSHCGVRLHEQGLDI